MKTLLTSRAFLATTLLLTAATCSRAAILSLAGNDTLVGNRSLNLIANGSFEADGGVAANGSFWATGTGFTPTMSLTAWTASGQGGSYAVWGNDGFGGIQLSAPLPHGTNALYFGAGIMQMVAPWPVEANNGLVTFTSTPAILPKPTDGPVTLQQTVTGLNTNYTYLLDFWTSGEDIGDSAMAVDGFFGLLITGESMLYFAAPSGNGPIGNSQRYQIYFQPTAPTITFKWFNWGHYTSPNGLSDELVLDDVILNRIPGTNDPIDCACITNIILTCPAVIPDLCATLTNCFTTNMLPGSCTQNLAPGMPLTVGTYTVFLSVSDTSSNVVSCPVTIIVNPPTNAPPLTVICPTNKTVECGSNWNFDPPIVTSSCCGVTMTPSDVVVSNSPCSQMITRTWDITDGCNNAAVCIQIVTLIDTTPPGTQCNGQNLVINGNFERYTNCPWGISQTDFAAPWFTPTDATPDYYNSCAGVGSFVTTPNALAGYQVPLSGNAYMGAHLYTKFGSNPTNSYREYLEVPLVTSLTPGQRYLVSFYVSRAEVYGQAIADIGARFMPLAYTMYGSPSNPFTGVLTFPTPPHIVNPPNNIITDSTNWTLIQGLYTAAGWESHLILGNFKDDPNTTNAFVGGAFTNYAYYYFDDVSVVAVCDPEMTNKVVQCGTPWVIPPLPIIDNCDGGNITVSNLTLTNSYCPDIITRTWFLEDQCGNANVITQMVTVVDTNPPILMCAGGANLAPNPQFENYSACPSSFSQVPTVGPWFNPSIATPDYFNSCTTFPLVSTPTNFGGTQTPYTGQGYAGAFVYSRYGTNPPPGYREYIEAPLLATLQAGVTYQVSFRVNLADFSGWAISEIGAHFSAGPVISNSSQNVFGVIPQVVNPSGNPLTSTSAWMQVSGTFTAVGGENHITLGNFRDDASTTAVLNLGTNSPVANMVDFSYYYFEDIQVVPLCAFTNKTVVCGEPWDFDTPLAYDECSGDFLSVFVTTNWTTGICPKTHTRVWTIYDGCANSITATQSVTELDFSPPTLLCNGFNMVPNGDFESYLQCPPAFSFLSLAQPWQGWSSEFYHACAPFNTGVSVPNNFAGSQTPFSGSGYGGCYVYFNTGNSSNSIREYLETPLVAPLTAGQTYTVSFRVSRADNTSHAIAQIGAAFTTGNVSNYFALSPQIVNPSTNIIVNSTGWTLISGSFTAVGGENTLTLGNFLQDASTTAQFIGPAPINNTAYYYFDDVKVIAACTNVPVKIVNCNQPWTFDPAPIGIDACVGTNVTVTLASTVTNSLCPFNAVRTWTITDACGNSNNWSQTVLVTNNAPFTVNCDCLMDSLLGQLTTNACTGVIPLVTIPTNSPCISGGGCGPLIVTQSPAPGTPVGGGVHNITLNLSKCSGSTNTCVVPFTVNAPQPTIICPPNLTLYTCTNFAIANFAPTAIGNTGVIVCSPPSGSAFPINTTNIVTCTATNSCGGIATCTFTVKVRPPNWKWACLTKVKHVISYPPPTGRIIYLPPFPGGGEGVNFADMSGTEGIRFDLGPAEKFTFSTVLDFNAPTNAHFELRLPPGGGSPTPTPLVRFERACETNCGWRVRLAPEIVNDPGAQFRAAAISDEGELFDSVFVSRAALDTNAFAFITPMDSNTNAIVQVTLDLLTREVAIGFVGCDLMPSSRHKGWDGCIYGNPKPRPTGTNKTARIIIMPPLSPPLPPISELNLSINNLATLAFDEPVHQMSRRKWSDGHVTLMKAYDDGNERGMEAFADENDADIDVTLGHAASFSFRMTSLDTNGVPPAAQQFAFRGWPPGTTTNRPPPPVINVRLAPDINGLGGVNLGAEFIDWGVSEVTLQLWNGTTLVAETNHLPAALTNVLATLGSIPGIIASPSLGVVSLSDTNPIVVGSGLDCGTLGCVGTELRIIGELNTSSTPPTAYTDFTASIGENMDYLIHRLETVPACLPVPLAVASESGAVTLTWSGDGFHLQSAETVEGPWYDLEVESPTTIPAGAMARYFRLRCD
jgi:hypothetical protein